MLWLLQNSRGTNVFRANRCGASGLDCNLRSSGGSRCVLSRLPSKHSWTRHWDQTQPQIDADSSDKKIWQAERWQRMTEEVVQIKVT